MYEKGLSDVGKPFFRGLLYVQKAVLLTAVYFNNAYTFAFNNSRSFSFGDNQRFLFVADRNTQDGISFDLRKYELICACKSSNE